jgi:Dolichyl-phosphate-mannose-protein mannosyltransferase
LCVNIFYTDMPGRRKQYLWLLFGLVSGLCIMCKIHGVFLWVGVGLYVLLYERKWLMSPWIYLSVLITAIIISPILFWNINNHFISFTYHGERVSFFSSGLRPDYFFTELGGQILYNNPVNVTVCLLALIALLRGKKILALNLKRLLLLLALPIILTFLFFSLFRSTLPHWSGPGYIALTIIAAAWLDVQRGGKPGIPKFLTGSLVFIFTAITAGYLLINFAPLQLGNKETMKLGDGDASLDMYGWRALKDSFAVVHNRDLQSGMMKPGSPIISNKWFPAAHIDYYIAHPLGINLIGLGTLEDIHKYAWINRGRPALYIGGDAYFLSPSANYADPKELYGSYFNTIETPYIILQRRGGIPVRKLYVYRLKDCIKIPPSPFP